MNLLGGREGGREGREGGREGGRDSGGFFSDFAVSVTVESRFRYINYYLTCSR